MMNIHHLELFFYVARHGGVSAAARQIPYGIQQPAISAQILELENSLGVTLFIRRPFQLTKDGQILYDFITPFFAELESVSRRLGGASERRLRIAAPEIVLREYLPAQLLRMKKREPRFHFSLVQGRQNEIEAFLLAHEIDLGLCIQADKMAAGIQFHELAKLDLILLAREDSGIHCAADVLEQDRISHPLITLGAKEGVSRVFQAELRRRGVDWLPTLELSGIDMVARYAAEGFGIGVSLRVPYMKLPDQLMAIPLTDFAPVSFGAMWAGRLSPLAEVFIEEAGALAVSLGAAGG